MASMDSCALAESIAVVAYNIDSAVSVADKLIVGIGSRMVIDMAVALAVAVEATYAHSEAE